MNEIITRNPRADEVPALRDIWKNTFGSIGEESFFRHYYNPEFCIVAEYDNAAATVGYLVPYGEIVCGSETIRSAMIYSVATVPQCRGMGLGTAVVNELIKKAYKSGFPAVVLCPSSDELFDYYSKQTGFRDWFYTDELTLKAVPAVTNNASIIEINATEYNTQREELLKGITHIKHDIYALEYQVLLCNELGGGLFRIDDSCAVVECQPDGVVWIKEFLTPGGLIDDFAESLTAKDMLAAIVCLFPADEYLIRHPARIGKGRRFGMLTLSKELKNEPVFEDSVPWYGMAFD